MTTSTLKKELYKKIDSIDDNSLLEAVYTILKMSTSSKKSFEPMSEEDFFSRNAISQKNIKEGKLISHTAIKNRFAKQK
ncbi:MAG: hypothetical protein WCO54_00255 [Bacteroidota bacterium]